MACVQGNACCPILLPMGLLCSRTGQVQHGCQLGPFCQPVLSNGCITHQHSPVPLPHPSQVSYNLHNLQQGGATASESAPLLNTRGEAASLGGTKAKHPLSLRCGHTFCAPCISEWVKGHTTCPVCRRDIDAPGNDAQGASSSTRRLPCSASTTQGQQQQQPQWRRDPMYYDRYRRDVWLPELMFRTRRLRLLYPDLVTDSMTAQFLQVTPTLVDCVLLSLP